MIITLKERTRPMIMVLIHGHEVIEINEINIAGECYQSIKF